MSIIKGLQKLTLLDYPGKVACTVFTGGCNFRCPFCHNASLVNIPAELEDIDEDKFFSFLDKRREMLDGVCVTGGEPLLRPELTEFLRKIKKRGYKVKLDTNGSFPDRLKALAAEGLIDYVAMDIKNSPALYGKTAGVEGLDISKIRESVEFLKGGAVDYEFRTTLVREFHDEKSVSEAAEFIAGAKRYFLQGFLDSGDLISEGLSEFSSVEMQRLLSAARKFVPSAQIRGE